MKLVLLPGMDGTGQLFDYVIPELEGIDTHVIDLPQQGPQDYETLYKYVMGRLPDEEFILLAESFSGGIAARISITPPPNLRGIIYVGGFLSPPRPPMTSIVRFFPVKPLLALPFASIPVKAFFLGWDASNELMTKFKRVVQSIPGKTIQARLTVISKSRYTGFMSPLPVVYIAAGNDCLVSKKRMKDFVRAYPNISFDVVTGPHFLLQAQPVKGAEAVRRAVNLLVQESRSAA